MSLPHFFLDDQVLAQEESPVFSLCVSDEDRKHMKALRLTKGEHINVIDGARDFFECEIVHISNEDIEVRIAQRVDARDEGPDIVLVQGIAKGDKMEDVIRHATEVGVSGFIPLESSRCVVKLDKKRTLKRLKRWFAIAKSAAKQSGRTVIPDVLPPMSVEQVAEALSGCTCVLVCWEECPATSTIAEALAQGMALSKVDDVRNAYIAIVVGPEGGLSAEEVEILTAAPQAFPVTLGPTILRTETAGVVAPALVLYECGGMGAQSKDWSIP